MTLSFNKFLLGAVPTDPDTADIRCSLCGCSETVWRLEEAVQFADQHECAPLRVTIDGRYPN